MCGCTSVEDVQAAIEAGTDAVGMIFAPSERRITFADAARIAEAVPPMVGIVGVFIDPSRAELEDALDALPRMSAQFSGSEEPSLCRAIGVPFTKVFHVDGKREIDLDALRAAADRYAGGLAMFETASAGRGGSGRTFDWAAIGSLARERRIVVSGGLTPENVGACVRTLRPYAVDVRTGVETAGKKDPEKMRAFARAVREADAEA
jgi:phosphoribosylanthranilate isomerase